MSSRFTTVISQCTTKTTDSRIDGENMATLLLGIGQPAPVPESVDEVMDQENMSDANAEDQSAVDVKAVSQPPQGGFLWRFTSGAVGGVYNVATGAAGMGYNTTKWVVNKGVEVGTNVVGTTKDVSVTALSKTAAAGSAVYSKLPVPTLIKGKDKKE